MRLLCSGWVLSNFDNMKDTSLDIDQWDIVLNPNRHRGLLRSNRAMCFWKSRTSDLGKGFKTPAPAWLAKRSPEASPSVLIREIRG